jgi:hypothetical protein
MLNTNHILVKKSLHFFQKKVYRRRHFKQVDRKPGINNMTLTTYTSFSPLYSFESIFFSTVDKSMGFYKKLINQNISNVYNTTEGK